MLQNSDSSERQGFIDYLTVKKISENSQAYYLLYYDKFKELEELLGLNQTTVNRFLSKFNHVISRATMNNYLTFIKRKDLEVIKTTGSKEKKKTVIIPEEHMQKLDEYFYNTNIRDWLLFEITKYGALRREEVVNIKLSNFINIEEARHNPDLPIVLKLTKTKRKKERFIILPRDIIKKITEYASVNGIGLNDKLFNVSKGAWWKIFRQACIALGYVKLSSNKAGEDAIGTLYHLHNIRHTTSSNWFEEGVSIVDIQARLGHENLATTRLYITPDEKKQLSKWFNEYKK